MLVSKRSKRTGAVITSMLLICLSLDALAQSVNVISLQEITPDKACGPRCLWALMQITEAGRPEYEIKRIYELIGKEPFSVTNLKDLQAVAEQLGFSAKGYKLTVSQLAKIEGYAVLPVGSATGTDEDPLHFILIKRIIKNHAIFVNPTTLVSQALRLSDLQDYWNGYALIITAGKGMEPLRREGDDITELPKTAQTTNYDQIKDFGQVDSGSVVEHTFTILTEKRKDYKAKIVQKNCACLEAKLGKDVEGRHTLTMELHVDKPAWQDAHAVVLLEPGGIIKRYAMRAYGSDTFEIRPRIAHIQAPTGGLIEYPVTIDYFTGSDDVVQFDRMVSSLANLTCGSVKSVSTTKEGATTFAFRIPLLFDAGEPDAGTRSIRGGADFILDTGKGQRHIPLSLTAEVGTDRFRITPEEVFLIAAKSSSSPIRKKVKIQFLAKPTPANVAVKLVAPFSLAITTDLTSPSTYTIDMILAPENLQGLSLGMNKGEVTIVPEGLREFPIMTLPISVFLHE